MHVQPLLLSSINSVGPALRSGGTSAPTKPAPPNKPSQPEDELTLSPEAEAAVAEEASGSSGVAELSPEETQQVQELKSRDREVRQHEQAHLAAAGGFALGGPTYTYQNGPDGQQYAIGGEVQIDTSPIEGDPEATIAKARVIRAAALAPAEPSSQDKAVAAAATQLMQSAQQELREREASSDETEELDGEKLLSSVDVNANSQSSEGSAPSGPSHAEDAAKSAVLNYFLKEAEQAYSQASPQSAGSLFLLA